MSCRPSQELIVALLGFHLFCVFCSQYFFHHRNAVDIGQVLREAYRLMDTTPDDIHPREAMDKYCPLTKGQYPVFNKYPKFIVDYQARR